MARIVSDREARLAAALRANLKRRKAQARTTLDATPQSADDRPGPASAPLPDDPDPGRR